MIGQLLGEMVKVRPRPGSIGRPAEGLTMGDPTKRFGLIACAAYTAVVAAS
jgi:hypothetical protein